MQAEAKKERKLFRVRKEDAVVDRTEKPDNFQYCMDCWMLYMDNDPDNDLGTQSLQLVPGRMDSDERDLAWRLQVGAATGAMIDGLSQIHRWAIYRLCSMVSVWNFPNADLLIVGPAAQEALRAKLKRNILTAVLF